MRIHTPLKIHAKQWLKATAVFSIAVVLVVTSSPLALALPENQYRLFKDKKYYFDIEQRAICDVTDVGDGDIKLSGNNTKDAWDFFTKGMGLPPQAAAGIIGNFLEESSMDPAIQQGGGHSPAYPVNGRGFGIAQWTFDGRQKPLMSLASRLNKDVRDLGVQLLYVKQELEKDYLEALSGIREAKTPGDAAFVFHKIYEVSADSRAQIKEREDAANDVMAKYGGGTTPTTGADAGVGAANCDDGSTTGGLTGNCQVYGPDGKLKPGQMTGNEAILACARLFDPYGYDYGAGHEDPESWMKKWVAQGEFKNKSFRRILDCTSIEMMAIYLAFGVSISFSTRDMGSMPKYFKQIPVSQAQPGDLMWRSGHTEIATVKGGQKTFGAHTNINTAAHRQISDSSGGRWTAAFVYIGDGSTRK
jgi:hypothetical protein